MGDRGKGQEWRNELLIDPLCVASQILISIDQILWTTSVLVTLFLSRSGGTLQYSKQSVKKYMQKQILSIVNVTNFILGSFGR